VLAARAPLAELGMLLLKPDAEARATVLASETGLAIDLAEITFKLTAEVRAAVAAVAERHRLAEVSLAGDPLIRRAAPRLTCATAQVVVPPGVFTQAVGAAEEEISKQIMRALGKARSVADLFSGIGPFSFAMARQARVAAFDSDSRAIAALSDATRHVQGMKPIAATVRDLVREPLGRKELEPFDAVVLDPPRAGAKAQAETLAKSQVPTVVMVSCNPATLARDCRILVDGGYSLGPVMPIDQFLWSAHVEAVVVARRLKIKPK
jgi:23S rRNA (uracil1939-C5)-methyltransferase